MKQSLLKLGFMLMLGSTALAQAFTENFDNITTLFTTGWNQQNLSTPIGTNPTWTQGDALVFAAYNGATNAYISTNYNNVTGAGTISNWLLTPQLTLNNGDVISFYTRGTGSIYPDNLQVRLSTNGASTNVGASNTSVRFYNDVVRGKSDLNGCGISQHMDPVFANSERFARHR